MMGLAKNHLFTLPFAPPGGKSGLNILKSSGGLHMHCPKCGTVLPDEAAFCPNCGAPSNSAGAANASPPPETKTTTSKKGWLIGAGIMLLLIVAATQCEPEKTDGSSVEAGAVQTPPLEVTATELFNAYQTNEASTQSYFGKRPLLISGTVDKVTLDFSDDPVVGLVSPNQFMSVQAALADDAHGEAGNYNPGDKVKLLCEDVSEVAGTPMLKGCRTPPKGLKGVPVEWTDEKKAK
jgi:hypothetical protein